MRGKIASKRAQKTFQETRATEDESRYCNRCNSLSLTHSLVLGYTLCVCDTFIYYSIYIFLFLAVVQEALRTYNTRRPWHIMLQ